MSEHREAGPPDRSLLRHSVARLRAEGKTRAEIGEALGITQGAVGVILHSLISSGVVERRTTPTGPSCRRLDRWERVLELMRQGCPRDQIASALGVSSSTLWRDLVDLRDLGLISVPARQGRTDRAIQKRRRRVGRLRKAGKTLEAIAQELGVSGTTVIRDLAALRRRTFVQENARRHTTGKRAIERARLRLAVLRLRLQGMRPHQISGCLGVSPEKVAAESHLPIRLGWIEERRGSISQLMKLGPGDSRYETIVSMTREGATLEEVGRALRMTRERVRQLRDWIEAAYGPIASDLLTAEGAARYLGISEQKLRSLAAKGAIHRVGPPTYPRYRREDLQALRHNPAARLAPKLLGGPYRPPRCRVGSLLSCEYRDRDVKVAGLTDAPIPWPYGHHEGGGGPPSIIVCGDLVQAIRTESLVALAYYWGVTRATAGKWRRALGVGRATDGTRQLYQMGLLRANGKIVSKSYRSWTPEEVALLGSVPDVVLAERLGRTVHSVASRRRRMVSREAAPVR